MKAFKLDLPAIEAEIPQHISPVIEAVIQAYFDDIKAGRVISKPYAKATVRRRRLHNLPTNRVRLYGSNSYSRKSYRLLTVENVKWKIKHRKIEVSFERNQDQTLWNTHRRRYSEL